MRVKRRVLLSAALICLLFCSCMKDVPDYIPNSEPTASSSQASYKATNPSDISSSVEDTAEPDIEAGTEHTPCTEISTVTEASSENIPTDTDSSETAPPNGPTDKPISEFNLPDDFYTRLSEIFDKYQINQNCLADNSGSCGCLPEYEETDTDGNVIVPRDRVMSLYFMDIESGFELQINGSVHYPVASTIKIPYCIYIYQKLENGEIDPNLILTYEKRHYFKGTGVIIKGDFGQQYSVLELLKLAITESDNVAFEMLKDLSSWDDFSKYLEDNGFSHIEDRRKSKEKICSESAGTDGRLLADYLRSDGQYVDTFKADLLKTKNKMIRSHYTCYRKYGWTNFAFHDIAYIEAPHPYVLAVLSNLEGVDKKDYELFKEVSYLIEEYSELGHLMTEGSED